MRKNRFVYHAARFATLDRKVQSISRVWGKYGDCRATVAGLLCRHAHSKPPIANPLSFAVSAMAALGGLIAAAQRFHKKGGILLLAVPFMWAKSKVFGKKSAAPGLRDTTSASDADDEPPRS
jgi:hypothetical protein